MLMQIVVSAKRGRCDEAAYNHVAKWLAMIVRRPKRTKVHHQGSLKGDHDDTSVLMENHHLNGSLLLPTLQCTCPDRPSARILSL